MMKKIVGILCLFLSLSLNFNQVNAQETDFVSFGVNPIFPENQVGQHASYFDIEVTPGQEQVLEVVITNSSQKDIKVAVSLNQAATNSNGVIAYDGSEENYEANLNYSIHDIATLSSNLVSIPANSQETLSIYVQAPQEPFDGQILSGLQFLLVNEETETGAGMAISNEYAYVIGFQLSSSGNTTVIEPALEFVGLELTKINYRDALQTTFRNTAPVLVSGIQFEGSIFEEGSDQPIYTRYDEFFSIAPNNQFNFPIRLNKGTLKAGNYIFKAKIMNEEQSWEFEEAFTIS